MRGPLPRPSASPRGRLTALTPAPGTGAAIFAVVLSGLRLRQGTAAPSQVPAIGNNLRDA